MDKQDTKNPEHSVKRSMEVLERAQKVIPGVAQLISRRPNLAAQGVSPIYAERAKGCRIWDLDGKEYVDWTSAVGPIILGYADEVVDGVVKEQIDKGSIYSILHETSVELAEELIRLIPSAEMVRYAKGGGEACTVAIRIARGITGKDQVLFCGYHGWHDWYLAANLEHGSLDPYLFPGIEPIGVPKALEGTAIPFAYGDLNMLEDLLKQNRSTVACIIMEPMRSEIPPDGYLEGVRELASKYEVVLIFDEVSTGFRIALGGVQEYTGVIPDISVFAKAISNGYPMAAIVGKREVMALADRMFISSAYWDDNVGIVAALTTLKELQRRNAVDHFKKIGISFKNLINRAAQELDLDAECVGISGHPRIKFNLKDEDTTKKVTTLFIQENARRGIILATGSFFNCAHDQLALEKTEKTVYETFSIIKNGLKNHRLDDLLNCNIRENLFRRMVK